MRRRLRLRLLILICLGSQAWAVAEASQLRFQAIEDPASIRNENAGTSLPPGWGFHPISPLGTYPTGQGNVDVTLDPTTGRVLESYREGDVEVREPLVISAEEYNEILSGRTVHRLWNDKTRQTRSVARGQGRAGSMFRFDLPVQFPGFIRSIVGDGAPNIEVSGSESITLSGTSDWVPGQRVQTERQQQSGFPSLEMKQELNVNLTGSIGDKIKVDVDQSSNVQTAIDNKVKLRYEGDEDDMIRSVELGNTNLSVEGASFRQEGLFGIKTVAKLGNVDLVTIASKQEGKTETARFTPSGENKQVKVRDLDYIHRTYFLIADKPVKITPGSIRIYKDDFIPVNTGDENKGLARLDPTAPPDTTNPEIPGNYALLQPDDAYTIEYPWTLEGWPSGFAIPVIHLKFQLGTTEVLAVAYTDESSGAPQSVGITNQAEFADTNAALAKPPNNLLLKMIKPRFNDLGDDATGFINPSSPWYPALGYELRNYYDLGGRDIAIATLNLHIRQLQNGSSGDPEALTNPPDSTATPLIVALGLDQKGRAGSATPNEPDGRIDDEYIDPVSGILRFPDIHPFAPQPSDSCRTRGGFNCLDDATRNFLSGSLANRKVYFSSTPTDQDTRYYLDADYKSSTQGFFLGRFDILENSEQVKVDGIPKVRGTDYTIDYQSGQLTFISPPQPDQTITVDFSFSPGFGTSQLTLLGASASYVPGPNLSVTSSVLYDTRGAQEKNPKLGEEPARSVIGDLASVVTFRPVWMTALANVIPGVRSTTPSTLNIQGHAAVSVPNPNTAGEAYIDDMEGNRESNTASISRTQWFWSSTPLDGSGQPLFGDDVAQHAMIQWYNPPSTLKDTNPSKVKEWDLKPVLTKAEGGDAIHHVLEMTVNPPTGMSGISTSNWTGLTQSLGTTGQDFSRLRYIEIWINDFTPVHDTTQAKLHVDFGRVSEDAFWQPDKPPNKTLDTEDRNEDGRLDRLPVDEDVGFDGQADKDEVSADGTPYNADTNPDPHGDDYHYDLTNDPSNYSRINFPEGSSLGDPNGHPDTEDLNRDGFLDMSNAYFEATVDLHDATFVAIDVARDYANDPKVVEPIKPWNGWRLFRIPLASFRRVGSANWANVQHLRVWVDSLRTTPFMLQVGGIELVGNRYVAQTISPAAADRGVQLGVGVRNNKDDADIYQSPYQVGNAVGSTATRREQSLALRFASLASGDSVLAFKTTTPDQSGLGWTQYSEIRFWVHGEPGVEAQNLRAVARFGADTVNYYEYSVPVRTGWQNVIIPMEALSGLKETGPRAQVKVDSLTAAATGEFYTVFGNPSFTRIYRTTFGVEKHGGTPSTEDGEVWINDLRLSGVHRDKGTRGDVTVQANFADVIAMNITHERQDENFFRVGTGANQGSGLNHAATGFSTTFNLDRIMPTSGVQLPIRFSMQHTSDVPKFRTGSDVVLTGARSDLETREQNRQSVDLSYRRSGSRKGLARFTIDALSGAVGFTRSNGVNPTSKDSSWAVNASSAYDLPVGGGGFSFGSRLKVNILPDVIGFSSTWLSSRDVSYGRSLEDRTDSTGQAIDSTWLRSDVLVRQLILGSTTSWTPLSSVRFRYNIASTRNMLLHEEGPFGFNKGTEIDQRRGMEVNYTPRWLAILSPNLNVNGTYHESSRPELRILTSDPEGMKNIDNRGAARVTATLPIGRFTQKMGPKRGAADAFAPIRLVLSRLSDIQGTFSLERSTVMTRVVGDAGFWFETGLTEVRAPDLVTLNNSVFSSSRAYTTGANTTVRPTSNITVDARADHRLTFTDGNLGARRQLQLTLPDLRAKWLELNRLLGLSNSISSMSLNSGYNLRHDEIGPQVGALEQRVSTTTWQPLLGWDLVWRNGLRANIATTVLQSTSVDDRSFGIIGERQTVNTDIKFTKVFPSSRGIRFPWSKKRVKLPNDLNLNMNVSIATDRKVTKRPNLIDPFTGLPIDDLVELNTQRLSVTSGTSYNFTQSISGGFNLGYRNNKDLKTDITTRGITIAFTGQFRF